jgi:5-methylcytosine-specific restriction protein B
VRVFDSQFARDYPDDHFRDSRIIFRAEKLGKDKGPIKQELLKAWEDVHGPPPGVDTKNRESAADQYFATRNEGTVHNEAGLVSTNREEESAFPRYKTLWEKTCIRGDFFRRLETTIERNWQVILEGPPGAGKTFVASAFSSWWTSAEAGAPAGSKYRIIQLHESYGYEDFFQGIRPVLLDKHGAEISANDKATLGDKLVYRYVDGVFRTLCREAALNPTARFVLIIDEINRGKTSRIFGELLYLMEYRDKSMVLASGEEFKISPNVYLIGTMNTAGRSIALVDYALRRRFRFIALRPFSEGKAPVLHAWLERQQVINRDRIVRYYCALNRKISIEMGEHQVVGHSYFMLKSLETASPKQFEREDLDRIWEQSLLPLLGEYQPGVPSDQIKKNYGLEAIEADCGEL